MPWTLQHIADQLKIEGTLQRQILALIRSDTLFDLSMIQNLWQNDGLARPRRLNIRGVASSYGLRLPFIFSFVEVVLRSLERLISLPNRHRVQSATSECATSWRLEVFSGWTSLIGHGCKLLLSDHEVLGVFRFLVIELIRMVKAALDFELV